jgi:hypothetical protein
MPAGPLFALIRRRRSSGLAGMPSSSTGAAFMAGVAMSMSGVWVATAGEVLCGNVPLRVTGEMGPLSVVVEEFMGGEMGVGAAIVAAWIAGFGAEFGGVSMSIYV